MSVQQYSIDNEIEEEPDDIIPEEISAHNNANKELKRYNSKSIIKNTGFISVRLEIIKT
jgi:hypothetical protein